MTRKNAGGLIVGRGTARLGQLVEQAPARVVLPQRLIWRLAAEVSAHVAPAKAQVCKD